MSLFTIRNEFLTVTISDQGAEIRSVKDQNGIERMWQADPNVWNSSAPIMFPVCGGYKDDTYYMNGRPYMMTKHGFAKLCTWDTESREESTVTFLLKEKRPGFPFDYEFRAVFSLEENRLQVKYNVKNTGSETFIYGIGSHEAYATPEGIENYSVCFEQPEDLYVNELDGNLIIPEPMLLKKNVTELKLDPEYFKVDALVFRSLKSRSVTLKSSLHDRTVRVDFDGMDVFMLWQKYRAGYICIEPWCNAPDTVDTDQMIEHKPGMITLAPGCEDTRTHTVTFG